MIIKIRFRNEKYLICITGLRLVSDVHKKVKQVLQIDKRDKIRIMLEEYVISSGTSAKVFEQNQIYDCYVEDDMMGYQQSEESQSESIQITNSIKSHSNSHQHTKQKQKRIHQQQKSQQKPTKQKQQTKKSTKPVLKRNIQQSQSQQFSSDQQQDPQQIEEKKQITRKYYDNMKQIRSRIKEYQKQIKVTSIEDFVGGQVDYYFSTKNYFKDNFLKNSQDQQGWVNVRLFLSFPKIHKLQIDEKVLIKYLKIYNAKNYELNHEGNKIRRIHETF